MSAVLLSLLFAVAPVPRHLFPPPAPDAIRPGFRWLYAGDVLAVHEVEGECVTFRCLSDPGRVWPGMDGFPGANQQSRQRVRDEAARFGVPFE